MMPGIQIKHLKKSYGSTHVLHDINLDINAGEFVVLIGESGCGKSTLLRMIAGLETITGGELLVGDKLFNGLAPEKRDISMVFQSYALYPHMNVYDNIAYGMKVRKLPKNQIDQKVKHAADTLNISHLFDRFPRNISGGQRQRVAMGRAIVRNPAVFLFDEPLSNLDAKLRVVMRKEIKQIQKELNITTVYVTHDQVEAMTMADKVVLMDQGRIEQIGSPKDLFDHPNSIFCASFLGSPGITLIRGSVRKTNGKFTFCTKDGITLPMKELKNLNDGQKVILGIRPQDFKICAESAEGFKLQIGLVEYTGAEYIIYGAFGKNDVTVVFSRKEDFNPSAASLSVQYDLKRTHVFDEDTGKIITE